MTSSLKIISFFFVGLLLGLCFPILVGLNTSQVITYTLYALVFLVGVSIGSDQKSLQALKRVNLKIFLVPIVTITGSFLGALVTDLLVIKIPFQEVLAVSAGFGYYSMSAVLITGLRGETLGTIALFANLFREIFTLLLTPLLVRYFDKLAPIASGGATAMDSTLPIITKSSGKDYAIIAIISGVIITIAVPFLISFILK